jgi:hypothetical protein
MKSLSITYLIAISGTVVPSWIADALLQSPENSGANSSYDFVAMAFYAMAIWGTSFGFFYLGKYKYGFLSAFGKWFLLFGGVWTYQATTNGGHPYEIFLLLMLVMSWGIFDLVYLSVVVKKINANHNKV